MRNPRRQATLEDRLQRYATSGNIRNDRLDGKELIELYRLMVFSRQFDRKAVSLQRQGRIGTYPMLEGYEAAPIGSASALGPEDWVYPSYREHGVQLARDMPIEVALSYWRGLPNRDWDVHKYWMRITTVPIASQLPHAVGHAYAARLAGEDVVTATYFGHGATSENDFHSGMNFAGVWNAPTVFICTNNRKLGFRPVSHPFAPPVKFHSLRCSDGTWV